MNDESARGYLPPSTGLGSNTQRTQSHNLQSQRQYNAQQYQQYPPDQRREQLQQQQHMLNERQQRLRYEQEQFFLQQQLQDQLESKTTCNFLDDGGGIKGRTVADAPVPSLPSGERRFFNDINTVAGSLQGLSIEQLDVRQNSNSMDTQTTMSKNEGSSVPHVTVLSSESTDRLISDILNKDANLFNPTQLSVSETINIQGSHANEGVVGSDKSLNTIYTPTPARAASLPVDAAKDMNSSNERQISETNKIAKPEDTKNQNSNLANGASLDSCANCGCTSTSTWRKRDATNETLCNACGLYERVHFMKRPASLINRKPRKRHVRKALNSAVSLTKLVPFPQFAPNTKKVQPHQSSLLRAKSYAALPGVSPLSGVQNTTAPTADNRQYGLDARGLQYTQQQPSLNTGVVFNRSVSHQDLHQARNPETYNAHTDGGFEAQDGEGRAQHSYANPSPVLQYASEAGLQTFQPLTPREKEQIQWQRQQQQQQQVQQQQYLVQQQRQMQHQTAQLQHPTAQLQHQTAQLQHPTAQLQHQTAQLQHPTAQLQHPAYSRNNTNLTTTQENNLRLAEIEDHSHTSSPRKEQFMDNSQMLGMGLMKRATSVPNSPMIPNTGAQQRQPQAVGYDFNVMYNDGIVDRRPTVGGGFLHDPRFTPSIAARSHPNLNEASCREQRQVQNQQPPQRLYLASGGNATNSLDVGFGDKLRFGCDPRDGSDRPLNVGNESPQVNQAQAQALGWGMTLPVPNLPFDNAAFTPFGDESPTQW
ncbi:hypothetical protein SARC_08211 [Sphaeroforma arctica JP610]|uniref:GATA-type domain-containing protein n=1 Tax=Sphaeroforma arctica JP610 TaxID=667725 RepID=A0A0L0FRT0_9EUKA|nr:hypothetical protein SARC_08211 [Sphaeroforma arctica JP610]KNC79399.1 hypothetical protein SARC_08211 [Sphaeroforma arctica JP610]|eukprot:XP_014153301.1 hypothetical protein SARC_08211 [Sphaeroforma arctica JP610]